MRPEQLHHSCVENREPRPLDLPDHQREQVGAGGGVREKLLRGDQEEPAHWRKRKDTRREGQDRRQVRREEGVAEEEKT